LLEKYKEEEAKTRGVAAHPTTYKETKAEPIIITNASLLNENIELVELTKDIPADIPNKKSNLILPNY